MDSPRLTRSISYPTNVSRENKEGDPYCALTESISFGRYMTESLAWEKWSTFSHNRYLEEAEKYSKPGSVAQMKAFFEAHFKKRAAKKAQVVCEEVDAAISPGPEIPTSYETHSDSYSDAQLETHNDSYVNAEVASDGIGEQLEKKTLDSNSMSRYDAEVDELAGNPIDGRDDLAIREVESVEAATDQNISVVDSPVCISKALENADKRDENVSIEEEKTPAKGPSKLEQLSSSIKKRLANSLSKSSTSKRTFFKPPIFPPKLSTSESDRNKTSVTPNLKKSGRDSNGVLDIKKYEGDSNGAPNVKKSGEHLDGKKRFISKSLHMSINFGSHAPESRTTLAKDCSTSSQNQMRVSASVMSKHPPKILQSEDKRTKTQVCESIPGREKGDVKQKTLTVVPLKPSSARGSKSPSPIKFCPFSFMTDERAAKRKEFHQKLQEKTQVKETEKTQISVTKPQALKLGRKSSRPPHRPSVDTEISKQTIQKNDQRTSHSVTSLPRKSSTRENFSPNIQR